MPSRFTTLAIVAFWLATSSWWFYQEIGVHLWPGEPPPFIIDLLDEVRSQGGVPIRWTVYRDNYKLGEPRDDNKKKVGYAITEVKYEDQDDLFALENDFNFTDMGNVLNLAQVRKIKSTYRVTRSGALHSIKAELELDVKLGAKISIKVQVDGTVKNRRFSPKWRIVVPGLAEEELQTNSVEVSLRGSVLNPLHPLNRISDLRPGQSWSLPLVDPLADSVMAHVLKQTSGVKILQARVLPETRKLTWGVSEVPCLVIDYRNEEINACTWVRQSDGLVLQQEVVSAQGERLILHREP